MPKISVIVPYSKGMKELSQVLRDFKNQIFKDFELLIIHNGKYTQEFISFTNSIKCDSNVLFTWVKKDFKNKFSSNHAQLKNYGATIATGDYVVFCDEEDRHSDTYLETLMQYTFNDTIGICQASCQETSIDKNGSTDRYKLVPEIGLYDFPVINHIKASCLLIKKEWALALPWNDTYNNDYFYIKDIYKVFKPQIHLLPGMKIDTKGLVTKNIRDWVSIPPFYRNY